MMGLLWSACAGVPRHVDATPPSVAFHFDGDEAPLQSAWTGEGGLPRWTTLRDDGAPSGGRVLAPDGVENVDRRFVLGVAPGIRAADGVVWVRFKPVGGSRDRAGGLAWRVRDAGTYYVARANALEENLRVYKVIEGRRIQLASRDVDVASGSWHTLVVSFEGTAHSVSLDEGPPLTVEDDALRDAGSVAVWTKSDSMTYFDDLTFLPHDHPSARALRARDLFEMGAFEDGSDEARRRGALMTLAEPRNGFHAGDLLVRGLDPGLWSLRGEPQSIRKALGVDWKDILARGAIEERMGQEDGTYDAVLSLRPVCIEALLGRARVRLARGMREAALRDAELALAFHPDSPRTLIFMAKATRDPRWVDRALELNPTYVPGYLARGTLHLMAGRAEEAIRVYDRAIELDPEGPSGWYNRGLAWEQIGNHDRAMKDARRAEELGPEMADPSFQIGHLLSIQGDLDGAEAAFHRALDRDGAHMKAVLGLGWVAAHRERWEEALRLYDRAIALDPSLAETWALRGNALWKLHRVEESVADYTKAIERAPSFAVAYVNRGMAYAAIEKHGEALRDFERAVELDPRLKMVVEEDMERARSKMKEH